MDKSEQFYIQETIQHLFRKNYISKPELETAFVRQFNLISKLVLELYIADPSNQYFKGYTDEQKAGLKAARAERIAAVKDPI